MPQVNHDARSSKAWYRTSLASLCLCTLVAGCNSASQGPETHPVTGRVTYQGEPIAGVTLTFHPQSEGNSAQVITDDKGEFDVFTYYDNGKNQKRGMAAGEYRVSALKLDRASIKSTMQPPKNLLPQSYASPETSGLKATVVAGQDNTPVFDLK
jgi:hypothetical protein